MYFLSEHLKNDSQIMLFLFKGGYALINEAYDQSVPKSNKN